jgi:hypothetical protein
MAAVHQTSKMDTNGLLPGDLVLGCEEAQIMVPPGGLYVDRTSQDKKTYGIWVWWRGATQPELFNPLWTWFIEARKEA